MLDTVKRQLIVLARGAAELSYSPYSRFRVGAAVLSEGRIHTGCNIENASYGLTICAERAALFKAISSGNTAVDLIAISCIDAHNKSDSSDKMPCGACRQVIAEFSTNETLVVVDGVGEFKAKDLLPSSFRLSGDAKLGNKAPSTRLRLCIDIDNVVAESDTLMREIIYSTTKGRVNLRYEDVKAFDYRECVDAAGESLRRGNPERGDLDEWTAVHDQFSARVTELDPYPGIQQILRELSETFDLHFATSRLPAARSGTVWWLEKHQFPTDIRLHFLRSGEKHVSVGQFFASVEDELSQALAFSRAGFHSFLRAHPWNSVNDDSSVLLHRCETWEEIADLLFRLAKMSWNAG